MPKLASVLVANLELILAGMSIPVICLIHLFVSPHFDNPWKITAAAALAVGVLHSGLGWMVRARQRTVRLELLRRIWGILQTDLTAPARPSSGHGHQDGTENPAREATRLALAQLPALVREPVAIWTMPSPMAQNRVPDMHTGLGV